MYGELFSETKTLIVGAGIAGLYTAWRLLESGETDVVVVESLQRVGGRLATSKVNVGKRNIQVEEGGMRFLDRHLHLAWLLRELGLTDSIVDFGMGDENNLFYIRGRRFTRQDAYQKQNAIWGEIFSLRAAEIGKSPVQILEEVKSEILTGYADTKEWRPSSPEDWQAFRTEVDFRGQPLYKWGFRALLAELGMSEECVKMLIDSGGFACPYDAMINAGSALQLLGNFPETPMFRTLRPGYQMLPELLRQKIEQLGGRVETGLKVMRVDRHNNGFVVETADPYREKIFCSKVVLTLPAAPLGELAAASPPMKEQPGLLGYLRGVVHMPLTKINLYFDQQWWRQQVNVRHGGCFTDLPLAQVYFFEFADVYTDDPCAITIYCDSARSTYWNQLQSVSEPYRDMQIPEFLQPCSKLVVKHCLQQLKELFGVTSVPEPLLASYRAWGSSGTGQGDHQWAVGVNDKEAIDRIWNPTENLFICGEAFSDDQAWVEGALRSAERMLQVGFGLQKPPV